MRDDVRRLVVMRHGKAEPVARSDQERRLTERGRSDAAEAGRWARGLGVLPDHAFVSSAARAAATWSSFASGAGIELDVALDPGLYSAGVDAALEVLRSAPATASTVMLVGHNPTVEQLAHLLDDGTAEPDAFAAITEGFPTSAVAVLEVASAWSDLDLAGGRLVAFHVGRG